MTKLSYKEIITKYPVDNGDEYREEISQILKDRQIKIVVLDDDPTGIQTVHGCLLLTNWQKENIQIALKDEAPIFYILLNTRSMTAGRAKEAYQEAVNSVIDANEDLNLTLLFVSRSDSTLRGHFPLEPDTARDVLTNRGIKTCKTTFFAPCLIEAGRYTLHQTHYLINDDSLIPVAESEFADDSIFGYQNSYLPDYILDKSEGEINLEQIGAFSIDRIRKSTPKSLAEQFGHIDYRYAIVDAICYKELRIFSLAVLKHLSESDKSAIFRASSSLPNALSGMQAQPFLETETLNPRSGTGIFIIGSHTKKTSEQLTQLLKNKDVEGIEINVSKILDEPEKTIRSIMDSLKSLARSGITPVIYTSRKEIKIDSKEEKFKLGMTVSAFLVGIVKKLPYKPAYIVAKGGITSDDILKFGLNVKNARVAGQALPGIPVIITRETSALPELPYIIFPGNVGDAQSLSKLYEKLI